MCEYWLNYQGGDIMSYVDESIRDKFESLSTNLKTAILERDVRLNNIHDLIRVLEDIVSEAETEESNVTQ